MSITIDKIRDYCLRKKLTIIPCETLSKLIAAYNTQSKAEKTLDKIESIIISDIKDGISERATIYKIVEALGEE